jgi:hypothetical protein
MNFHGLFMARSSSHSLDPWRLVWGQPYIDSSTLAAAIVSDLQRHPQPDYRTRLLVRDAAQAIRSFWGAAKFQRWLAASPVRGDGCLPENQSRKRKRWQDNRR